MLDPYIFAGEWVDKMWYSQSMEYYLAVIKKKKEILIDITTLCVNFRKSMLSERSQTQRPHII